jgi:hypothetical protein
MNIARSPEAIDDPASRRDDLAETLPGFSAYRLSKPPGSLFQDARGQ